MGRRREAWEGNVSPILHFTGSLEGSKLGQRTKVATLGAMSPREQANLNPPLAKGVPNQPSPPSLHTHSPSPSYNRESKSPEEKREPG